MASVSFPNPKDPRAYVPRKIVSSQKGSDAPYQRVEDALQFLLVSRKDDVPHKFASNSRHLMPSEMEALEYIQASVISNEKAVFDCMPVAESEELAHFKSVKLPSKAEVSTYFQKSELPNAKMAEFLVSKEATVSQLVHLLNLTDCFRGHKSLNNVFHKSKTRKIIDILKSFPLNNSALHKEIANLRSKSHAKDGISVLKLAICDRLSQMFPPRA